jgi:GNAT superfamily N-acetyltransferase
VNERFSNDSTQLMPLTKLPSSPIPNIRTIELTSSEEPILQRFFDANRQYFLAVNGEPAGLNEAHEEIHGDLPPGWSFTKKWLIGYVDTQNELVAMANIVSDLLATGVWHIGLFVIATSRHGTGDAQAIYRGLEAWAIDNGAQWLRLGVVQGNARAERFWESLGYIATRTRDGVAMGKLTNTIRVMVKPLAGSSLEQYLSLIERDRPDKNNKLQH